MEDFNFLLNYGVLGAWTVWLLYEKKILFKKLTDAIHGLQEKIKKV